MCCIFTCCGWMIDLVQRLWTFTMSCCISSAVCCVMLTSSMSGIALGYNYSLSEFIDLKETNVSIYLKRGVFDDDIADDMDWRRAARMPVKGHINEDNLRTGPPEDDESSTLRSGRRLDDSVFEAEDQNKYEGSLMKLTAKPAFVDTTPNRITDDLKMEEAVTRYPMGSLNQMKAIQSLIDSRRAMGTGGTTNSPLATYSSHELLLPYLPVNNNPNAPGNPDVNLRRMMASGLGMKPPYRNPARYAVPNENIGSRDNWVVPKNPAIFNQNQMPDYFVLSPTYPSAITIAPPIIRPTGTLKGEYSGDPGPVMFATRTIATTVAHKKPAVLEKLQQQSAPFNERFLLEGDVPSKNDIVKLPKMVKSSEEEYEDEIKGLPVRKRRSIKVRTLVGNARNSAEKNIIHLVSNISTAGNSTSSSVKNISTTTTQTDSNNSYENNFTNDKNQSVDEKSNDSEISTKISNENSTNQQMDEKLKPNLEYKVETIREQHLGEKKQSKSLLDRLITTIEAKKLALVAETTTKANFITAKKIKMQTRRKSFESKIVTSKYVPNNKAARLYDMKETAFSNQEILSSISVSLNEAGLLRNPASSTFVKLLQSTLT